MKKVNVRLGAGYDILIGAGLLAQAGSCLRDIGLGGKAVVVTNPTVKRLYGDTFEKGLSAAGFQVSTSIVDDGEEHKSLETATRLYTELSDFRAERKTPLLAFGGGVIGDVAGFVAATYLRGIPLVQVPTTLLAQVDSSIGGKVAINYGQLKNKIGAFYQPKLVISDINLLKTLTPQEMSDGLAETIKYGIIQDRELFAYLGSHLSEVLACDEGALETIVYHAAKAKADVVAQDELDLGFRNILNFGHTIGHGVESASGFKTGHGRAVSIGMVAACEIAVRMGLFSRSELNRLENLLLRAGLPVRIPNLTVEQIMPLMRHDKKIARGKFKFILPKAIGDVFITDAVSPSLVEQVIIDLNEKT
jgi:3-dehydroquinate synthase